jgi:uncharacterized protein YkwD
MSVFATLAALVSALIITLTTMFHPTEMRSKAFSPTPTLTVTVTPTDTPTNTPLPTSTNTPTPAGQSLRLEAPAGSPLGGASPQPGTDLNSAVNQYRKDHGLSALQTNGNLCRIASTRVAQQVKAGSLDNHAGFQGEAASQKEFLHVGEILQYRSPAATNEYLVYTGWAGSPQHNAIVLDPGWTHGCGARTDIFAAFIFAR